MDADTQNDSDSGQEVSWMTHPMVEYPQKAAIFWTVFLLVLLVIWVTTHQWIYIILSGVILFASLRGFVLPTRYRMTQDGIEIDRIFYKVRKTWDDYRSYVVERHGVFLSPFSVKHRLENFRGVFIPTRTQHQQVVKIVGKYLEKMK